jgi:RHS repeat-associated protein
MNCCTSKSFRLLSLAPLLLSFFAAEPAAAQAPGIPPFSTVQRDLYDTIKINDGGVLITLPVRTKNSLVPFVYLLVSNDEASADSVNRVQIVPGFTGATSLGLSPTDYTAFLSRATVLCPDNTTQTIQSTGFLFVDGFGTEHVYPKIKVDSQKCMTNDILGGSDSSGYSVSVDKDGNNRIIIDSSGNTLTTNLSNQVMLTDPNGNQLYFNQLCCGSPPFTFTYFDSTLNTPMTETRNFTNNAPTTTVHSWTDAAGNSQSFTIHYSAYVQKTHFACSAMLDVGPTNVSYPSSITTPDGQYSITYEPTPGTPGDVTGRIAKIVFPSGASIQYAYTGGNSGITCPTGTGQLLVPILTRTLTDATGVVRKWIYNTSAVANATVVTDPSSNDVVHTFSANLGTRSQLETSTVAYQGSRTNNVILASTLICYNGNLTNCATAAVTTAVTKKDVYTTIPGVSQQSRSLTTYDNLGNLTEDKEYDFGPTLVSDRIITYGTYANGSCSALNNIDNHICSDVTKDGSGRVLAQSHNTYDSHGNLTTASNLVGGTTYLSTSVTYNANGTPNVVTDVNGAQTTYTGYTCNGNFPTGVSEPLGLSKAMQWDCNGGVITSLTDENSQPTIYSYKNAATNLGDPYWRVLSVTDPVGAVMTNCYGSMSGSTCSPNPTQFETVLSVNSGSSATDRLTTTDGFGRAIVSQTRQTPTSSNFDTISTSYDLNGRVASVSIPCVKTAGLPCPTTPATTTTYDGLSRPKLVTDAGGGTTAYNYTANDVSVTIGPAPTSKRQMEYDGLGRLTSVCEVTANTLWPPGACAQKAPLTGYWTKYTYDALGSLTGVSENAQGSTIQTRSYTYDSLNRLTSETNPEWNSLATTYSYDTDATCGTSNGDLVKKLDPAGNVTCTTFDALHRPTGSTYPSGPNASVTAAKYFQYDNQYFGSTGTNIKGRLVAAATCQSPTSCAGNSVTLEEFGYSARGELTNIWESTPHSAGMYHITSSYWPNGRLNTLQGVSLPTLTYGLDGEGRPNTVSASSGINPVYATTYNTAGQATDVIFGATSGPGDPVDFGYDPNTGRMTQYKLTINGTATHGDPTWNANGTLGSLSITDPFNASDAQNCNYGYDDMARLASVDCGATKWQQNFTYDPFGNITKSVPSGGTGQPFLPGYNESNNRYTDGATYDANGNLMNDGTDHVYTWDSDGHPLTLDSETLLYDALGREVEVFKSGAYTEFVFGPTGKLALMNGQTQTKAFVPLPGGTQVKYAGNAISTYRLPDWLGSFRVGSNPNRTYSWGVAFAPFGEQYAISGGPALSFTGEEGTADTVSDEYDFLARKLHSVQGRWISPDPAGVGAADPTNPQSWNLYAYVRNNPLSAIDPFGLNCVWDNGSYEADDDPMYGNTDEGKANCERDGGSWLDSVTGDWNPNPNPALQGDALFSPPDPSTQFQTGNEPIDDTAVNCSYIDPLLFRGIEITLKAGPAAEFANVSAGVSFTHAVGDDGVGSEAVLGFKGLLSIQRTSDTANLEGSICCQNSITILGFKKDLATDFFSTRGWTFNPSKEFKLGLQGGLGFEVGWNSDKYKQAVNHNRFCGYYNHH